MKVGDKVTRIPAFLLCKENNPLREKARPFTGTVVYVHTKGRYYTVEFDLCDGKITESYTK